MKTHSLIHIPEYKNTPNNLQKEMKDKMYVYNFYHLITQTVSSE